MRTFFHPEENVEFLEPERGTEFPHSTELFDSESDPRADVFAEYYKNTGIVMPYSSPELSDPYRMRLDEILNWPRDPTFDCGKARMIMQQRTADIRTALNRLFGSVHSLFDGDPCKVTMEYGSLSYTHGPFDKVMDNPSWGGHRDFLWKCPSALLCDGDGGECGNYNSSRDVVAELIKEIHRRKEDYFHHPFYGSLSGSPRVIHGHSMGGDSEEMLNEEPFPCPGGSGEMCVHETPKAYKIVPFDPSVWVIEEDLKAYLYFPRVANNWRDSRTASCSGLPAAIEFTVFWTLKIWKPREVPPRHNRPDFGDFFSFGWESLVVSERFKIKNLVDFSPERMKLIKE